MKKESVALMLLMALTGCSTPGQPGHIYDRTALLSASRAVESIVVNKRSVGVSASTGVGSLSGGAVGAIGGSGIGGNTRDGLVGAVVGAVIGSAIGAAAESNAKVIDAIEYIVKSDVTGLLAVVQSEGDFQIGQKVYLILGNRPLIVKAE